MSLSASNHPCRLQLFAPPAAPASRPPRVWFAMLTYNALEYTKRCVLSLDHTVTVPWHLLVLDNTSTDGTREWLASLDDPRITVSLAETNLGVAGGRNRQLALLEGRVPDDGVICFIDNDLEFFGDWVPPFLRVFDEEPTVGIVSTIGYEVAVREDRRELLSVFTRRPFPVDVAAGGFACCVRPAVFRAIGGFDEALNPFWHEDDDIAVRARAAGWEVFALPNDQVIHHGHKSGAAVPWLKQGGSLVKQRYLLDKWRTMGLLAGDGRLTYPTAERDHARRLRLAERMGRTGAVRHAELERAIGDIGMLVHAMQEQQGQITGHERFASAPALAFLDDHAAQSPGPSLQATVRERVQGVLASRRRATRLAPRPDASPTASTVLADVRHWDDASWFRFAVDHAFDGRGEQQWYDRTLATWRAATAAWALHGAGVVRDGATVLVLGPTTHPLVWGLAAHGCEVIVADFARAGTEDAAALWRAHPEQFAIREVPPGRVRVLDPSRLADGVRPESVDAALCFPWHEELAMAELSGVLAAARPCLRAGAPFGFTLPVRLAGPPKPGLLDGPAAISRWLAERGLTVAGGTDFTMSDDGLLAARDAGSRIARTPDLLVADGPRLTGHMHVTAVRTDIGREA